MSTEVGRPVTLVSPATGEVLTLHSASEDLARYLADIREHEFELRVAKKLVSQELSARMDKAAAWTLHLPGLKVSGQSPAPEESWDGAELRSALLGLVDEGVLDVGAVDAAVETVVTYKPRKSGINALRKLGGRVAETVDLLCRREERERRVTVTVLGKRKAA